MRLYSVFETKLNLKKTKKGLKLNTLQINSPTAAENFFREIWDMDSMNISESFYLLFVNRSNRIIGYSLIATGGFAGVMVDPKMIFSQALQTNCSGILVAHNHPSGKLVPSESDIRLTENLVNVGKALDLPLKLTIYI